MNVLDKNSDGQIYLSGCIFIRELRSDEEVARQGEFRIAAGSRECEARRDPYSYYESKIFL